MKSFNCFKDSSADLLRIFEELQKNYFAHLSYNKQQKETLFEHSKLVSEYCLKLIDAHGIEEVTNALITHLVQILPIKDQDELGNLFKESFIGAIVYHDLGKANPNFQVLRMGNELFVQDKNLAIQTNHSFLGAYLYSNVFFKRIFENGELNEDDKLILYFIVLLFSVAIQKHHNPTIDLSLIFDDSQVDDCYSFMKTP